MNASSVLQVRLAKLQVKKRQRMIVMQVSTAMKEPRSRIPPHTISQIRIRGGAHVLSIFTAHRRRDEDTRASQVQTEPQSQRRQIQNAGKSQTSTTQTQL